jgi:hypothetical protein
VVKIFNPMGAATWLLCSLNRNDPGIADGLCDLGLALPRLVQSASPNWSHACLPHGLRLERDLYFRSSKTLGQHVEEARVQGFILA